jgi:hypothetical protein
MPDYECEGTITETIAATDEREAAAKFYAKYGRAPEWAGDTMVFGRCEGGGGMLLEGDNHVLDYEGARWCAVSCAADSTEGTEE